MPPQLGLVESTAFEGAPHLYSFPGSCEFVFCYVTVSWNTERFDISPPQLLFANYITLYSPVNVNWFWVKVHYGAIRNSDGQGTEPVLEAERPRHKAGIKGKAGNQAYSHLGGLLYFLSMHMHLCMCAWERQKRDRVKRNHFWVGPQFISWGLIHSNHHKATNWAHTTWETLL